jgi:hypothetical protein
LGQSELQPGLSLRGKVTTPLLDPANLNRTESGEERLALHKNHEGWAQAVRAMGDYGMTAVGRKADIRQVRDIG